MIQLMERFKSCLKIHVYCIDLCLIRSVFNNRQFLNHTMSRVKMDCCYYFTEFDL
jgi:hypothetical protein